MLGIQNCDRCTKPCTATTVSFFNTQTICLDCWQAERKDPRYQKAREAEEAACRRGDFNFPGIGR